MNQLPANVVDQTNQIVSGCGANTGNSFVVTGRGGISQNPSDRVDKYVAWSDVRDLSVYRQQSDNVVRPGKISNQRRIIEATGFQFDEFGNIELVALKNNSPNFQQSPDCGRV